MNDVYSCLDPAQRQSGFAEAKRAFARSGLRSVLLWMLGSALAALFLLLPFSSLPALLSLVLIFAVAVVALLLPALGVHRRLAESRRFELARAP